MKADQQSWQKNSFHFCKYKQFQLKQKHPSGKFQFSFSYCQFLSTWLAQSALQPKGEHTEISATKLGKQVDSNPSYKNNDCFWSTLQSLSELGILIIFRVEFVPACNFPWNKNPTFNLKPAWPAYRAQVSQAPSHILLCLSTTLVRVPWAWKRKMMQKKLAFTWECNVTYYTNRYIYAQCAKRLCIIVQESRIISIQ